MGASVLRDRFDTILFIVTFLIGLGIIYFIPNGKDGYWFIPLVVFWAIRFIRRINKVKREK